MGLTQFDRGELSSEEVEAAVVADYDAKIAALERKVGQLSMEFELARKTPRLRLVSDNENSSIITGPKPAPFDGDAKPYSEVDPFGNKVDPPVGETHIELQCGTSGRYVASFRTFSPRLTTATRSSVMPDVPTVSELPGMEDYRFSNWMSVFAPAGTPDAVV